MSPENLKQILPKRSQLLAQGGLHYIDHWIKEPNLWHCNRKSISAACFIGLFVALIPLPLQMLLAALLAIVFKANLPLSVSLVWITNPITIAPIFYFAYQVGSKLLGIDLASTGLYQATSWSTESLLAIWPPLITGSLLLGTLLGLGGFYLCNWLWRKRTLNRWRARAQRRRQSPIVTS